MERNWYWRIALVAGVLVLSVYQLLPSWYYFRLAPDKRSGPEYEQSGFHRVPPCGSRRRLRAGRSCFALPAFGRGLPAATRNGRRPGFEASAPLPKFAIHRRTL